MAGRAEPQVIRLSLIYALLDQSAVVRVDHIRAAMAVWRYYVASAWVIFDGVGGNPVDETIMAAVRKGPLKTSDIHLLFSNHQKDGAIKAALQRLVDSGLIRMERQKTGGRPAEVWMLA